MGHLYREYLGGIHSVNNNTYQRRNSFDRFCIVIYTTSYEIALVLRMSCSMLLLENAVDLAAKIYRTSTEI